VPAPVLELGLFDTRAFRWANAGLFTFAIAFSAMFLGNVLFLTEVWHYPIVKAGLAISVGPLIVAVTAPWFGRLAGRIGQRRLLLPGGLIWAAGGLWLLRYATTTPDYVGAYLPAACLIGLGVSLLLPQLSSAAVQGLPPDRFGSGSAVTQAVRNLGATIGVALVVAFTTGVTPATVLDAFHHIWWLLVTSGVGVTLLSLPLPAHRPASATARPQAPVEVAV
jgi:MFS family permease